jgi:hypothetical protein
MKPNSPEMYSPAFPLGWQISMGALNRLDQGAIVQTSEKYTGGSWPAFYKIKTFFMQSAFKGIKNSIH